MGRRPWSWRGDMVGYGEAVVEDDDDDDIVVEDGMTMMQVVEGDIDGADDDIEERGIGEDDAREEDGSQGMRRPLSESQ